MTLTVDSEHSQIYSQNQIFLQNAHSDIWLKAWVWHLNILHHYYDDTYMYTKFGSK